MGKKIFVICAILIVVFGLFNLHLPETNLLKAILPQNSSVLIRTADKYSSAVNVIFEADDEFDAEILKDGFCEDYGKDSSDLSGIFDDYKSSQNFLLSENMRSLLKNKDYKKVYELSENFLYNPTSIIVSDPKDDPFMLFSDFITSLSQKETRFKTELNGKGYAVLNIKTNDKNNIKKLFELQKKYSDISQKVYLTGSPIHSFYTSEHSSREINIIAVISTFFVLGLSYFYFRNLKVLIPIIASIFTGICLGFFATSILFKSVHVLTFVFSTTLIGICVDYSLHWFVENDKTKLFKSLTDSLVTTVGAFVILLFANIPLLKEISVFTSIGLITVYFIVKYFYSDLKIEFSKHPLIPKFQLKNQKFVYVIFLIIAIVGMHNVKFSDDITSLYKPSAELAASEKIFNELSDNSHKTILAVNGKNIQEILDKEESLKQKLNSESTSLSDFIPSVNTQKENEKLIKKLYNSNFLNKKRLSKVQKSELINHHSYSLIYPNFEKYPYLRNFMIDDNTSLMVVNGKIPANFSDSNVQIINIAQDISSQLLNHRNTCLKLVVIAFVILFAYLFKQYGKDAIRIILPSVFGIITSISALGLSSQPVNLFHIFAMFLILGFTLDYSIFRIGKIKNSKDAVLISCLTTSFSFFLLTFTSFKLISSLGFVLSVGIFTSYLFSLLLIKNGDENEMV